MWLIDFFSHENIWIKNWVNQAWLSLSQPGPISG